MGDMPGKHFARTTGHKYGSPSIMSFKYEQKASIIVAHEYQHMNSSCLLGVIVKIYS